MNVKEHYSKKDVVKNFDSLRFENFGGCYVNSKECSVINLYDLNNKKVLDLPGGTGRLSQEILKNYPNCKLTCADYSTEMLKLAKKKIGSRVKFERIDLFNLKHNEKYDFVFSLRFFFHYPNLERVFIQFNKILQKNGFLIFDTLNWSPHQLKKDSEIYAFSHNKIVDTAKKNGFKLILREEIFIIPSRLYPYLPKLIVNIFDKLEKVLPKKIMTKTLWVFKKVDNGGSEVQK